MPHTSHVERQFCPLCQSPNIRLALVPLVGFRYRNLARVILVLSVIGIVRTAIRGVPESNEPEPIGVWIIQIVVPAFIAAFLAVSLNLKNYKCDACDKRFHEPMTRRVARTPSISPPTGADVYLVRRPPEVVWGFIFAILGLLFVPFSGYALYLGYKAKRMVRDQPDLFVGSGLNTAVIVLGWIDVGLFLMTFLIVMSIVLAR